MASSSGNSSGFSPQNQNSGSEPDLQMDQRKRKRMQSNRESARRSRLRKQKHLDDLMAQVTQLNSENSQIVQSLSFTTQQCLNVEAENSVLRAQMAELSQRLESLNDILNCLDTGNGVFESGDFDFQRIPESFMENSWNLMYSNQPIMTSAHEVFQY